MLVWNRLTEETDGQREIRQQETQRPNARAELGPGPEVVEELNPGDGTPDREADKEDVDECKVSHRSAESRVHICVDGHCYGQPEQSETRAERTQSKCPRIQYLITNVTTMVKGKN